MIAHQAEVGNAPPLTSLVQGLLDFVLQATADAASADHAERGVWTHALAIGHAALALFFRLAGTGDLGQRLTLPDGADARRLDGTRPRRYRCVFGDFTLERACYGSRDGQKITFVPLDNRLQLPESDYSYLLQEWDQALGTESAFAKVAAALQAALGIRQPVDSLERGNRQMAQTVEAFRDARPLPAADDEAAVFVLTDDGKGIPLRKGPDDPAAKAHRGKGDKANKKRMAIVGAIYSVDRYPRTAEEVTAALFRDPRAAGPKEARPVPVGKHVWARLSKAADGNLTDPIDAVFAWQKAELDRRAPIGTKPVVCVMDGQELLWEGKRRHFGDKVVEVLDLLHVTPRLWQAAHAFYKEGTKAAAGFVRDRVFRVLRGQVRGVVKGLRRAATVRGLTGSKAEAVRRACAYLSANAPRMRYDEYLKEGYPVASGVIEGACRHYVKDRMERSGMRWTKAGAQGMLDVRSEYLNGDWQAFQAFRIRHEADRLYPHRSILDELVWPLAA